MALSSVLISPCISELMIKIVVKKLTNHRQPQGIPSNHRKSENIPNFVGRCRSACLLFGGPSRPMIFQQE
jgi:hypothetical protein